MKPYTYANGEVHGDDPTKTPDLAQQSGRPARGRATFAQRARLAARRAALDPNWASRSPESKRRLLDLDLREGHQ